MFGVRTSTRKPDELKASALGLFRERKEHLHREEHGVPVPRRSDAAGTA
ncbi:MAG TPA: hypothetical protein VG370_25625 [Chloroflexota bacterium]|nr:hypothetical protein [Chloroflexota bacterium]